ncbi:MAG: LicD family protein [Coriobacteriales bacterium]
MSTSPYPHDSLQRLQAIERDIVAVIDELCRKNSIDYFIDGGTCLGAARHGGFIPWDDDVDLGMPKADYDRFCALAPEQLPEGYSLHTSANTKGFSGLWAKVFKDGTRFIDDNSFEAGCEQGAFVDIFPYCQLDADPKVAQAQCSKARMAQLKSYLKHFSRPKLPASTPLKPLVELGCKFVHATIARTWKQEDLQKAFDHAFDTDNPAQLWTDAAYPHWGSFETDVLFPTVDIDFDGLKLRAPHDCESYLTTLYGDYMQLPPENERYTHAPVILDLGDGIDVMETGH